MTPEELFHTWYAADADLPGLLDPDVWFTGDVLDESEAYPYAVILIQREKGINTNTGSTYQADLEIEVFSRDWSEGRNVCDSLFDKLDNSRITGAGLTFSDTGRIYAGYLTEPDGVHRFRQRYSLTVN